MFGGRRSFRVSITNPTRLEIAGTLLVSSLFRRLQYKPFVKRMCLRGDEDVLDFGSGWGDVAFYVSPKLTRGGSVTLLDISSGWQQVAKRRLKRFPNLRFVNSDIFSAGIEDNHHDVIVVHFMLHDIPQPERSAIVSELAKKLKSGGYIYLGEPTVKSHGISVDEIQELVRSAGLSMDLRKRNRRYFEGKFTKP
jgi:ubiquinone/menaquinone biosynthesis C-methylase UbiE